MEDGNNFKLTSVRKLFQRRAQRAKTCLLNCLSSGKRWNQCTSATTTSCDGQTQTSPTIHKSLLYFMETGNEEVLQAPVESCVADSSRDSLNSDSEPGSSGNSMSHICENYDMTSVPLDSKQEAFLCMKSNTDSEPGRGLLYDQNIMDKLRDVQQTVHLIHATLCSLKSGETDDISSTKLTPSSIPPPPPPPLPSTPTFIHSISLQSLTAKSGISKIQYDEMHSTQDRSKPIVTLEDLQKVKLRQVSNVTNVKS